MTDLFGSLGTASFYAVCAGVLMTAVLTVAVRNLFHSAIALAFTLIGVALVYFFLHAEFIAVIQILIYVGAIMTLVIFAIMLTSHLGDPKMKQTNQQCLWAAAGLAMMAWVLIPVLKKFPWKLSTTLNTVDAVQLGKALMNEYVFPFEMISIVLLAALIGAILVSRND